MLLFAVALFVGCSVLRGVYLLVFRCICCGSFVDCVVAVDAYVRLKCLQLRCVIACFFRMIYFAVTASLCKCYAHVPCALFGVESA